MMEDLVKSGSVVPICLTKSYLVRKFIMSLMVLAGRRDRFARSRIE